MRFASCFAMILLGSSQTAWAGCEDSKAYFLNQQPRPERAAEEIDVQNVVSEEGGSFLIYRNKSNLPDRIVRIDFSPMGRHVVTLAIGAPNDLMITDTQESYIAPFGFTNRENSVYYFFCDGKLQQEEGADLSTDYAKAAKEAAAVFFAAPEVSKQLRDSAAIAPEWK